MVARAFRQASALSTGLSGARDFLETRTWATLRKTMSCVSLKIRLDSVAVALGLTRGVMSAQTSAMKGAGNKFRVREGMTHAASVCSTRKANVLCKPWGGNQIVRHKMTYSMLQ